MLLLLYHSLQKLKEDQNIRPPFYQRLIEDLNNQTLPLCIHQNQALGLNQHVQKEYESLRGNFHNTQPNSPQHNNLLKSRRETADHLQETIPYVASFLLKTFRLHVLYL